MVVAKNDPIPHKFTIQAAPNPFNPLTTIFVRLPEKADVTIEIHDVLGRRISSEVVYDLLPGEYGFPFAPESSSSGVYIIQAKAGMLQSSIKVLFLR